MNAKYKCLYSYRICEVIYNHGYVSYLSSYYPLVANRQTAKIYIALSVLLLLGIFFSFKLQMSQCGYIVNFPYCFLPLLSELQAWSSLVVSVNYEPEFVLCGFPSHSDSVLRGSTQAASKLQGV